MIIIKKIINILLLTLNIFYIKNIYQNYKNKKNIPENTQIVSIPIKNNIQNKYNYIVIT